VANSAVQYLAVGQAATETFTVTVSDGRGGSVNQTVTVTVTGTNDAPVLTLNTPSLDTFESGVNSGTVVAGSVNSSISTSRSDVDIQDGLPTFVTTDWTAVAGTNNQFTRNGDFGTATLNTTTGSITYLLNQSSTETQALARDQVDYDRFNVSVTDGHVVTSQVAAFKVVGADDSLAWATGTPDPVFVNPVSGGRTAVNLHWSASDIDSLLTYSAHVVGTASSNDFALVSSGGYLSGLASLGALPVGNYSLLITASNTDGQALASQNISFQIPNVASQLDANASAVQVLTGTAYDEYLKGTSLLTGETSNGPAYTPTFIGKAGNDVLDGMTGSQAFVGGVGNDTAIFTKSVASLIDSSSHAYFQIGMMPVFTATDLRDIAGTVSNEFVSAIDPTNSLSNNFGFLSVATNGSNGPAYVQAENILVSYDLTNGSTTTSAFHLGTDTNGRALLALSDQADRLVGGVYSDNIDAGAGDDVVYGAGNGSSELHLLAPDAINGGSGDDILAAGTYATDNLLDEAVLNGGVGDDVLVAVSGKVTVTGGSGRDVFALYTDNQNVNMIITDFNTSVDRIDLSGFSALKNLSAADQTQTLSNLVQNALHPTSTSIELDLTQYMTNAAPNAHATITLNTPVADGQLSAQSFIFDKPVWEATNWHISLDPLVHSS
jgi:VCBS repeat-containing protein